MLYQTSQQGQSVVAVGSHNLNKKDSTGNHNQKQINQPVLGRHKSKSVLSELPQQVPNTPRREKLVLSQLESPLIGSNPQKLTRHQLQALGPSQPPLMTQKEAMQRLKQMQNDHLNQRKRGSQPDVATLIFEQ